MDKTIEARFLEAFSFGGVVSKCIDWMRYTYQLPTMKPSSHNKKPLTDKDKAFCKQLLEEILEATKAFDDSVLYGEDSSLMDEIESNLNECQTDAQKERYLFSLLKYFGVNGCGIASIYTPMAEKNQLNEEIEQYAKEIALWATDSDDSQAQQHIDACREMIKDRKAQIEWVNYVNSRFVEIANGCGEEAKWMQEGTVESCLHAFVRIMRVFANRLDALLLIYGIDLLALQNKSGIYLKRNRLITNVQDYIGSRELAQYYIDKLPIQEHQQETSLNTEPQQKELKDLLPKELRADEAVKVFLNAMDAQLITLSPNGLMWNDSKQLLAYFATRMSDKFKLSTTFDKDGNKTTAWKPFETLFNVQDLKGAKQNWMRLNTKFEPNGFEKVDALF